MRKNAYALKCSASAACSDSNESAIVAVAHTHIHTHTPYGIAREICYSSQIASSSISQKQLVEYRAYCERVENTIIMNKEREKRHSDHRRR